jgi:hypothetical protein
MIPRPSYELALSPDAWSYQDEPEQGKCCAAGQQCCWPSSSSSLAAAAAVQTQCHLTRLLQAALEAWQGNHFIIQRAVQSCQQPVIGQYNPMAGWLREQMSDPAS